MKVCVYVRNCTVNNHGCSRKLAQKLSKSGIFAGKISKAFCRLN